MSKNELAAMLDELMGRDRDTHPAEQKRKFTFEDDDVCKDYICGLCPNDLFTNTKIDLGRFIAIIFCVFN